MKTSNIVSSCLFLYFSLVIVKDLAVFKQKVLVAGDNNLSPI